MSTWPHGWQWYYLAAVTPAPIAGALSDRIGGRPLMALGLALQATGLGWMAAIGSPTTPYGDFAPRP